MAGPFTDIKTSETAPPRLFSLREYQTIPNTYSASQTQITSMLAALAEQRNRETDENFSSIVSRMQETLNLGKENVLREGIATTEQQKLLEVANQVRADFLANPVAFPDVNLRAFVENELEIEARPLNYNALENQGISRLQELAALNPDANIIMQNMIKEGNTLDRIHSNLFKLSLLSREVDKLQTELENQGWAHNLFDYIGYMVPSNELTAKLGLVPGNTTSFWQTPGRNLQNEVLALWGQSDEEFVNNLPQFIDNIRKQSGYIGENLTLATDTLDNFYGISDNDAMAFNIWSGVDVGSVLPIGWATRWARNPSRMLMLSGNRSGLSKLSADEILKDLENLQTRTITGPVQPVEAIEESLPSIVQPNRGNRPWIGISSDISDELDNTFGRIRSIELASAARLEPEQFQEAVNKQIETMALRYKDENIVDLKHNDQLFELSIDPDTQIGSVSFYLGKRVGTGGYINRSIAEREAIRRGFSLQDVEIIQNVDGQWFIKRTENVTETGVISPVLKEADFKDVGVISQYFKNALAAVPDLLASARLQQTLQKTGIHTDIITPLTKLIDAVPARDKKILQQVLTIGERAQKWFNGNELQSVIERIAGRRATDREIKAYYAAKELSDFVWSVFDWNLYIERARRGVLTAQISDLADTGFDTGRRNAARLDNPNFNGMRLYDLETHRHGKNLDGIAEKYATGNYELYILEDTYTYKGEPVKIILAPKRSVTSGLLERRQLGYIAGGSRENAFKYFVKQTVKGRFTDGDAYYLTPKTHIAARTLKQAQQWADEMEVSRLAYNNPDIDILAKRLAIAHSPIGDYDKWVNKVENGELRMDTPFEVLFDRTLPEEMRSPGIDFVNWSEDATLSPAEQYYVSKGRMYYSKKGEEPLRDPSGQYAEILDPYTTLSRAIGNAMHTQAFADYNRKVIDEWVRVARQYLDPDSVGNNTTPNNIFFNARFSEEFKQRDSKLYNILEGNRLIHKRFLNLQTPEQYAFEVGARRFAEWVEGKGKLGEWAAGKALNPNSANPVDAIRGFVFDSLLGWFDPGQILLQTQTAVAAITVHPIYGSKAAAMATPIHWLMRNRSDNLLDYLAKNLKFVHGLPEQEFKAMINNLRNSKWMQVSGEQILLDQYAHTIGSGAFMKGYRKARHLGRYPFYLAERINRSVAYQIAWNITRKINPDFTTAKFIDAVDLETDRLIMSMTSASKSGWQKGVVSVPTQFMSYTGRMLEAMLPKTFGGNPRWSTSQKWRLALGQGFLYGTGGVYLGDWAYDYAAYWYEQATGEPITPEIYRSITKGFYDTVLFEMTGGEVDTDFSFRAGQGGALADMFSRWSDGSQASFLDIVGGASGSVTGRINDSVKRVARYFYAEQNAQFTPEQFELIATDLFSYVNSFRRATKAYWIWKMGYMRNPRDGSVIAASKLESMAALLGIPLRQETEQWEQIDLLNRRDEIVNDVASQLVLVRRRAFQAYEEGDLKSQQHFEEIASGLMISFRDNPLLQSEIIQKTNELFGYNNDRWLEFYQRVYERTGQEPEGGK